MPHPSSPKLAETTPGGSETRPAPEPSSDLYADSLRLALFEPDRPHNLGAVIRYAAAFGVPVDVIEPCGFPFNDKRIRESALDYQNWLELTRHINYPAFVGAMAEATRRLVLLSTRAATPYHRFEFQAGDCLLLGNERRGVPEHVHSGVAASVTIPMVDGPRSLNVATAGSIVLGEALRQLGTLDRLARRKA